jgi:hypothetical protein
VRHAGGHVKPLLWVHPMGEGSEAPSRGAAGLLGHLKARSRQPTMGRFRLDVPTACLAQAQGPPLV